MPTREQLIGALRRADEAGDSAGAQRIAEMIRGLGAGEQQAAPEEPPSAAATFIQRAGQTVPFVQQGASALAALVDPARQEGTFGERYTAAREALKQRAAAGSEAHPIAGGLGTAAGIAGQVAAAAPEAAMAAVSHPIASARALVSLPAAIPDAISGLSSALVHLGRGGGAALAPVARAAAVGGLTAAGLSEADLPLAQGRFGEALRKLGVDVGQGALAGAATGALAQGALARNERLAEQAAQSEPARKLAAADVLEEHTGAVEQARAAQQAAREANRAEMARASAANRAAREQVRAADEAAFQRARQAAEAQARAVSERNALPILGLEGKQRLLGKDAAVAGREARRIFNSQIPGENMTYGEALGTLPEGQAFELVQKTRKGLGEGLGRVREVIAGSGETVPVSAVLASVDDAFEPLERETKQRAGALVRRIVQRALPPKVAPSQLLGPGGQPLPAREVPQNLTGAQLRKVIEDIQDSTNFNRFGDEADRVLWAAYDGATKLERAMAGRIDPGLEAQYQSLNAGYRDAVRVEAGVNTRLTRLQASPNRPSIRNPPAPVRRADVPRSPLPAPVLPQRQPIPEVPAFPRGDPRVAALKPDIRPFSSDAEAFRAVRDRVFGPVEPSPAAVAISRGLGGAAAGSTGYTVGGWTGAIGAAPFGRQGGEALVRQFFRTAQPTRETLDAAALAGKEAIANRLPLLEAAVRGGPQAVNAIHRTLLKTDEEYRRAVGEDRTAQRAPVSAGEFFGGFGRGQLPER